MSKSRQLRRGGALSPPERWARSLAMVGAGSSLATVIGGPLGVLVGQQAGWRAALRMISIAAAPAAGLCLALPAVRLPTAGHAIDYHRVGAAFQVGQLAFALNCAARQLQPSSGMSNRP